MEAKLQILLNILNFILMSVDCQGNTLPIQYAYFKKVEIVVETLTGTSQTLPAVKSASQCAAACRKMSCKAATWDSDIKVCSVSSDDDLVQDSHVDLVSNDKVSYNNLNEPIAVLGSWGSWGAWSSCSETCREGGAWTASRTCEVASSQDDDQNVVCQLGNQDYEKVDSKTEDCNQDIPCFDPYWADWGEWSSCSETCGTPTSKRQKQRDCIGGPPDCPGGPAAGTEEESCNTGINCNAHWSQWSSWSSCSTTCDMASSTIRRERNCIEGPGCPGDSSETSTCVNIHPCDCYDFQTDYKSSFGSGNVDGKFLSPHHKNINTAQGCVDKCKANSACTHMTWVSSKGDCWLKTEKSNPTSNSNIHSAPMDCT